MKTFLFKKKKLQITHKNSIQQLNIIRHIYSEHAPGAQDIIKTFLIKNQ